jgi:hypothetical protein
MTGDGNTADAPGMPPIAVPQREHFCPQCPASYGVPPDTGRWGWLVAQVNAHLRDTDFHGTGTPDARARLAAQMGETQ